MNPPIENQPLLCIRCNSVRPSVYSDYPDRSEWRCAICGALIDILYKDMDNEEVCRINKK